MRLFLAREALDPHLKRSADLLRPGTPTGAKIRCLGRVLMFYAGWYPQQHLGGYVRRHRAAGRLAKHYRWMDRAAHRLARKLFHAMARHQQGLEKRQVLLGHLMEIGTELFAMSATVAYARELSERGNRSAEDLADLFCRQARQRIADHERGMKDASRKSANRIAGRVLDGEFHWLEDGIISAVDNALTPPSQGRSA